MELKMKKICFVALSSLMVLSLTQLYPAQDIIAAAKSGDAARVKSLLESNPELIKTTDGGLRATALHWACIYGRKEAAAVLLRYNPDVNTEEAHAGTPMHWAAHFDDAEVIGWLLDRGAEIDHVNIYGRTPLLVAARRNCTNVIDVLLERGAKIDATLQDGSTALHIAAKNGHIEAVDLLRRRGADSEAKNDRGETYKDVLFVRPKIIEVDPKLFDGYAGDYERENGALLNIRRENDRLFYYAYGKDELLPITETHFIRHAELGYFTFLKDKNGQVNGVLYKIGNSEYKAEKVK